MEVQTNVKKTVCFFGHHDCPDSAKPLIRQRILELYEKAPNTEFYVGNQGRFDALVLSVFKDLMQEGEKPNFCVVLAYHPDQAPMPDIPFEFTLYPEGIEKTPKRFAISWRNKWMVRNSDTVICYIRHWHGGAAKFVEMAEKKGKTIINLADD
ncbi:MAG: hypothetical protein MJ077_10915 [Oscillospiraceae bacterium]|nr:hypothetical protein [Oscillospiraceae bacterium]